MIKNFKLFERNKSLDHILDTMDDFLDSGITHFDQNLYDFTLELLTKATTQTQIDDIIVEFARDHSIVHINDGSSESEAFKKLLNSEPVDVTADDYRLLMMFYYEGLAKNSIVEYIFENYIPDVNAKIVQRILSMTVYSKYDDLFNFLINREGFDPSYKNDMLLSDCVDAEKVEFVDAAPICDIDKAKIYHSNAEKLLRL